MHSYASMRRNYGNRVSQTIDSPITIFDYWELGDGFAAIGVILVFGVFFYEWFLMIVILGLVLGVGPAIRKQGEKGVFFHWPYRHLGISLPGLINPKGRTVFSD